MSSVGIAFSSLAEQLHYGALGLLLGEGRSVPKRPVAVVGEFHKQLVWCLVKAADGLDDAYGRPRLSLTSADGHDDVHRPAEGRAAPGRLADLAAALALVARDNDRKAPGYSLLERLHCLLSRARAVLRVSTYPGELPQSVHNKHPSTELYGLVCSCLGYLGPF